ncbi:MAG: aminotransferase class IV [Caldilineaceae bacterium]
MPLVLAVLFTVDEWRGVLDSSGLGLAVQIVAAIAWPVRVLLLTDPATVAASLPAPLILAGGVSLILAVFLSWLAARSFANKGSDLGGVTTDDRTTDDGPPTTDTIARATPNQSRDNNLNQLRITHHVLRKAKPVSTSLPQIVSCNGDLIPPSEATVSVLGNVLYGAWGVYESIQLWDGVIFHLEDHLNRLLDSAAQIELPLAGDLGDHKAWVRSLIAAENARQDEPIRRATIRLFAVGPDDGVGPRSFTWLVPLHAPDAAMVSTGVGAVTYTAERALMPSR